MLRKLVNLFLYQFSPVLKFRISGHSMSPTLRDGQIVFVNCLAYLFKNPRLKDIIAAKIDGKVFIKRITKIERNKFFLSGDNPRDSFDSREFGKIGKDRIVGKVFYKFSI